MGLSRNYHHFAKVIAQGPATGHPETIAMVMKLSGGTADPNEVSDWWHQWVMLRDAMKTFFEAKKAEATVKVLTDEARRQAIDEALPLPLGGKVLPLGLPLFDQITPVVRRPEGEPPAPAADA